MEINTAFRILEIEHTKDEDMITGAYRQLLPKYNPEDDAEGFKNLRMAYETAINYARAKEKEEDDEPKTEIDIWMKKVETLYQDILSRGDVAGWKQLLDDDVCVDLDTSIDARDRILVFLMNNHYLPHEVWKEIAATFQIVEDFSELEKEFPTDFLDYVKYYAENEGFLPYELFEYISLDGENGQPDTYIRELLEIKRSIDAGNCDKCMEKLDNLKDYDIYHPYEDVERLKIYIKRLENEDIENKAEIEEKCSFLLDKLSELPTEYAYVYTYIGETIWCLGKKEEAYSVWKNVLDQSPDSYHAKYCVARYLYDKGSYEEANKVVEELAQVNDSDEALHDLLVKINEVLIEKYTGQLERGEENPEHKGQDLLLELGWKLWQNERMDDAIKLMESFSPDEKNEYGYNNLFGRLLCHNKEYERALPYIKRWNELLQNLDGIEPEEREKRLKRKPLSYSYMAGCLYEQGNQDAAEENMKQAISLAGTTQELLNYMQQYAGMLLKWERYHDAVDICDDIIKYDNQYYPAYLIHQEACFKLKKGQEVVDDYRMATRIVSGYYRPYMYAAMVYYYYGQYRDGLDVLKEAREYNITFNLRMMLVEEQMKRHLAQDENEREKLFEILDYIEDKLNSEDSEEEEKPDIEDIYCERVYLYWDNKDMTNAHIEIKKAIEKDSNNARYHLLEGDIFSDDAYQGDDSRFSYAITSYKRAISYGIKDNPWLYYSLGYCYERLDNMDTAVTYYKKALDIRAPYENICKRLIDYYLNRYLKTYKKADLENAMTYADMELAAEESAYSLWLKGRVYECGTEFDKAVESYEKAVELAENGAVSGVEIYIVWQQLGNCYRRLMKYDKAVMCLETSIKELNGRKFVQPYWNLAICYESMTKYDKAIEYYKQAAEFAVNEEDLWQNIGDCYRYLGKFDEAMAAYEKADKEEMHLNHAEVLFAKGDYKGAEQFYKKTVMKKSKENLDFDYILLGDFYLENLQDYKKALACFAKSKNLNHEGYNLIRANVDMVKAYYMSGNYKKAKTCAELALAAFQETYDVSEEEYLSAAAYRSIELYKFGWIYLGLGDVEKAKCYFRMMEEGTLCKNCKHNGCYEARLYLGIIYFMQGDMEAAREAFEEAIRRNPHDWFSRQMLKKVKN